MCGVKTFYAYIGWSMTVEYNSVFINKYLQICMASTLGQQTDCASDILQVGGNDESEEVTQLGWGVGTAFSSSSLVFLSTRPSRAQMSFLLADRA